MTERFFAPCPRGLEGALVEELGELGVGGATAVPGGAAFSGGFDLVYRINLGSRIASRLLWQVGAGPYAGERDLHALARDVAWERYFDPTRTLRVDLVATRSPLKSLKFATLTVKDGVCDRFRERTGMRPSIAKLGADVRVHAFLDEREATLYLDTSGEALFKRGYRVADVAAPIRENLAAGILRLVGWTPDQVLYDPMCGSGTFLIEAAQIALGIAPGARRRFGFYNLKQFDAPAWQRLRDTWPRRSLDTPRVFGSDVSQDALRAALANFTAAGVDEVIRIRPGDLLDLPAPAGAGVMIANPPYGERLGEDAELALFYPRLGKVLKERYAGWDCHFITADRRMEKLLRLKAGRRTVLMNGDLECRLFSFRIVAGSNRAPAG
ncbi:MAG: N-6 DNA methylase [Burkholderiales bacterium]|nr:N-6 DNA methylase [Burkholderiales bacterium]